MGITAIEIGSMGFLTSSGEVPSGEVIFTGGWFEGTVTPSTAAGVARTFTNQNLPIVPKKKWRR